MQKILILLLKLYRLLLSPYIGQHCRFVPTCSCYAIEAIQTCGALRGGYLALHRLLRCHPWCAGGFDPLPDRTKPAGDHPVWLTGHAGERKSDARG